MWQIEVKYQAVGCNDVISDISLYEDYRKNSIVVVVVTPYTNQVQTVTKLVNLSVKTLVYRQTSMCQ